mmetsp:Transcript_7798/g.14124  ORF Transcript_7798/g.14124 Transcript_7798/m.14124 type:complete len:312 (-) Transcript_7798:31-966(-)
MSDDESDYSDTPSFDSCEDYINFESKRNPSTQLEEAISFSWPGIYEDDEGSDNHDKGEEGAKEKKLRKIVVSTLLEEEDLAPLFDGSRWAGTRLWGAAVRGIQYVSGHLPGTEVSLMDHGIKLPTKNDEVTMLELGCGLGVPAMIYHMLGGGVVLTDQIDILSQLEKNVDSNFPQTAITSISRNKKRSSGESEIDKQPTIHAMPLSWSRTDINGLLQEVGRSKIGFDIVINCDCVYEPLYGKSWHLLNETIDELLKVNPQCVVLSSMERRAADGIDNFLEEMRNMEHVGSVERVWFEEGRKIEIYITRGII